MNENKKIPMWKKICYGCGAGGGNVMSKSEAKRS